MFYFFTILIVIAFIVRTVRQVFYQVYLWQLKEYRVDRFLSFLKTESGKKFVFNPISIAKIILFSGIYGLSLINIYIGRIQYANSIIIYFFYIFWLIWLLELFLSFGDVYLKRWKSPKFTLKSLLILLTVLIIELLPIANIYWTYPLLFGPFLDITLGLVITTIVLFLNIPSFIYKNIIYLKARNKLKNLGTTVIGITGSYGKTSTKEFLYQILTSKYKVVKTPGSYNTDIGIASYINRFISDKSDFFVVEMGAYKRGEIKRICKLVNPKIGIITGIGNQHMELFGTKQNLIDTKFELINFLSEKDGTAIFNGRSIGAFEMSGMAKEKIKKVYVVNADKEVKNLKVGKKLIEFDIRLGGYKSNFKAALAGKQHLDNLVLAIKTGYLLGIPVSLLKKAVFKIRPPDKTMSIIKSNPKLTIIDDSFNVNFEGVISALEYLKFYTGSKVMVLNPIIELGKEAKIIHRQIGKAAGNICNYLILTNSNYYNDLKDGIKDSAKKMTEVYEIDKNVLEKLLKELPGDSVIIFEGKESLKWMNQLKNSRYYAK